jgi:hypothetical protein
MGMRGLGIIYIYLPATVTWLLARALGLLMLLRKLAELRPKSKGISKEFG